MESTECIIFDLGGVFIDIDYSATITEFEKLGFKNANHLYSQAEQSFLFEQFEKGEISSPYFINKLLALSLSTPSPNQVVKAWNAMIGDFSIESITVLKKLQDKYRLFILSNTNELHIDLVNRKWLEVEKLKMESFFEKIHLSHELGLRKPYPETFLKVCELHGLKPSNTLFIDDSIQHVEGANQAGLKTIHLKKMTDLATELNAFGIN
jgi:HAD superfamily hydrolase (TIGR01509 family)